MFQLIFKYKRLILKPEIWVLFALTNCEQRVQFKKKPTELFALTNCEQSCWFFLIKYPVRSY